LFSLSKPAAAVLSLALQVLVVAGVIAPLVTTLGLRSIQELHLFSMGALSLSIGMGVFIYVGATLRAMDKLCLAVATAFLVLHVHLVIEDKAPWTNGLERASPLVHFRKTMPGSP
jgi:hypothetical protein